MDAVTKTPPVVRPPNSSSLIDANKDLEIASTQPPVQHRRRDAFIPGFRDRPPFIQWLRRNWLDIATQLLCLLTSFLIYTFSPPLLPRYFPLYPGIERSGFGRKYGQPYMGEYVSTLTSAIVSFGAPAAILGAIALWGTRRFRDGNAALIGLGYALATATLFQSFMKILIGGLRPHFLSICAPSIPPSRLGLNTPGPSNHLYFTASQVCTGEKGKIKEAQMSFPSGHACAAFAGFGFLALWLNAHLKVFGRELRSGFPHTTGASKIESNAVEEKQLDDGRHRGRIQHWKLVVFAAPLCIAFLLASSKIRDGWHHPVDIIFGGLVGTAFAHMAYRMVYRSVYNWRNNHIPMEK
ncbi:acid phosphatase/Vanadium-dependent haloperoxidase [Cucurbitaria berberidis CBS 394.84]|uniref:Acid phosphatase/Vanadium-dependent haloperoxidase n=1 Tax=Cucurbitaria berberidis CBS 394.84 TaxID=1168544 RepID=A0A9P4GEQ9_9PLEO|nr:acid phosphatase/Vanadium-dependent haloperoxidase [Cucurbitaria berberidis CBS 394.84]KAF1844094.1 acid phosphatase/Vanadium-dependent haloperoxidase [Cucurbitaria berberidis CBS 394.84]